MSDEKPARPQKPLEPTDDTTIGTQPWTAWVVAALGIILVVIVVFLALDRAETTARRQAARQSAPTVGGLVVASPVPTAAAVAVQVTSTPLQVTAAVGAIVLGGETPTPAPEEDVEGTEPLATTIVTEEAGEPEPATPEPAEETESAETATAEAPVATEVPPTPEPATPTPRAQSVARVPAVAPVVVEPGDRLRGGDRVRLYADADPKAPVLDAVAAVNGLIVLEPSGDFSDYPILRFGHNWARVRAADGLVGWVIIDTMERVP